MEDIIRILLEKPLAFIVTIGGILFLGLSGLTKVFRIEVDPTNSKRLFIAGILLIVIGIPIYYFGKQPMDRSLDAELISIALYRNDEGHTCPPPHTIHIRETYKISDEKGARYYKAILNQTELKTRSIEYVDQNGNYALNYCISPGTDRTISAMIISSTGKSSDLFEYQISSNGEIKIESSAPSLSKY